MTTKRYVKLEAKRTIDEYNEHVKKILFGHMSGLRRNQTVQSPALVVSMLFDGWRSEKKKNVLGDITYTTAERSTDLSSGVRHAITCVCIYLIHVSSY